jgi:hypothetical protein
MRTPRPESGLANNTSGLGSIPRTAHRDEGPDADRIECLQGCLYRGISTAGLPPRASPDRDGEQLPEMKVDVRGLVDINAAGGSDDLKKEERAEAYAAGDK